MLFLVMSTSADTSWCCSLHWQCMNQALLSCKVVKAAKALLQKGKERQATQKLDEVSPHEPKNGEVPCRASWLPLKLLPCCPVAFQAVQACKLFPCCWCTGLADSGS